MRIGMVRIGDDRLRQYLFRLARPAHSEQEPRKVAARPLFGGRERDHPAQGAFRARRIAETLLTQEQDFERIDIVWIGRKQCSRFLFRQRKAFGTDRGARTRYPMLIVAAHFLALS